MLLFRGTDMLSRPKIIVTFERSDFRVEGRKLCGDVVDGCEQIILSVAHGARRDRSWMRVCEGCALDEDEAGECAW